MCKHTFALQIREGRVKSISAKAAGELKQEGWVFLDVRPPPEIEKVRCSLDRAAGCGLCLIQENTPT